MINGKSFGLFILAAFTMSAEDRWVRLVSQNFELYTDAGAVTGRETLRRFEQIRHVFETRTQRKNLSPLPVRIFVFKSEADFRPYQVREYAAGYYQAGHERDYIAMHASGPDVYRVVFHEYVHLILRHAAVNVPVWFNEGTAELYSTLDLSGPEIRIGDLIPAHILTLRTEKMLDIATLVAVDHESSHYNERGKSGIFYAQSWALAHMLNFSPEYQPGVTNFLEMVLAGEPHQAAFQRAFGKTQSDVLNDLARYIRQDRFVGVRVRGARVDNIRKTPAEAVQPVSASLLLADLLVSIGKDDRAESIYARLAADYPTMPEVQIALGDAALRKNRDVDARRHYERAIELGSSSGRLHYDYAMLLRETGSPGEQVLRHLRESVRLDPKLFEAHHFLGYLSLREERFAEAIQHLRSAAELQPQRAAVWENLALAYHYSGSREKARAAARTARRVASNREEIERAEATLNLIESADLTVHNLPDAPVVAIARSSSKTDEGTNTLRGAKSDIRIEGILTQVDCLGSSARLHLLSGNGQVFLLVKDPGSVYLKNAAAVSMDFACGEIRPRAVAVEYKAGRSVSYGTAGEVTAIEFR
jgi:Flp pilus assembly protein TadD